MLTPMFTPMFKPMLHHVYSYVYTYVNTKDDPNKVQKNVGITCDTIVLE